MTITKTELFDVDVLQNLVTKEGITQKDKADLQRYRRRRINGNEVLIQYDFAKDYRTLKFGRLYPSPHCGLTVFPKDIRAALAEKYYWDIDIENAQPTMLVTAAKHYDVSCPSLLEYCENRDSILEEMKLNHTLSRDEAKTLCISVLFGGYRVEHPLLPKIYGELKELSYKIAAEHPKLFALCKSNPNSYASCLSLYIQNEERKVLEWIDESMTSQHRSLDVLVFDGGLVRKMPNETSFPATLLRVAEAFVFEKTGYSIRLVNKPLTHTFDFKLKELVYPASATIDDRFACEKFVGLTPDTFMRDGNQVFMRHPRTELWQSYSVEDAKHYVNQFHLDLLFKQEAGNGIKKFNYGGSVKNVTAMLTWMPQICSQGQVPIEFLGSLGTPSPSQPIVDLYLQLLSLVANHNEDMKQYLIHYLAHSIQKPRDLPGVCIIATGEQGSGKDTPFDIFMTHVLGSFYTANLKNEVFFSPYDDLKARKVMVKLEEASAKYCTENSDMLKNLITGRTMSFNPKHKSPYETSNFCRYIFTTNSGNPISIEGNDRRYILFNSSNEKVGNAEFWAHVNKVLFNEEAGQVLYQYFKSIDLSEFSPTVFPISEYQEAVRDEYKSLENKFYDEWDGEEGSCSDIHKKFVLFCKLLRLTDDKILDVRMFGRRLTTFFRDGKVEKRTLHGLSYYKKPGME